MTLELEPATFQDPCGAGKRELRLPPTPGIPWIWPWQANPDFYKGFFPSFIPCLGETWDGFFSWEPRMDGSGISHLEKERAQFPGKINSQRSSSVNSTCWIRFGGQNPKCRAQESPHGIKTHFSWEFSRAWLLLVLVGIRFSLG